ncbi:energy transducer TonB family protein [Pseudaquabacterium pictum]|uniref:energy transducer TonB family protein n=1 Tax=Pseudaquabacterium pictum TaxID=2315236 RepID=UPI001D1341D6|nr:energy transducer TonB [Rubrivivax pictus]
MLLCAGCSQTPAPPVAAPPAATAPPVASTAQPPAAPPAQAQRPPAAPPPWRHARDWDDYRHQAALRILALNPDGTYTGPVHQPALAIPVLEVELNRDGSVRRIQVLRRPGQATDTVQLAIDAVQRAAPFGAVGHLPRPWRFTETFLFDNQRRFKPRTLDL